MTSNNSLIGEDHPSQEMRPKILVTGANGFVGSSVCEYLASAGYDVMCGVRNGSNDRIDLKAIDTSPEIFESFYAVVHLAARVHKSKETSIDSARKYDEINREKTLKIAEKCIAAGVKKFIFSSSIMIYGKRATGHIDPQRIPTPDNYYGKSKWEAEQGLRRLYLKQNHSKCVILRLPMIYGPRNKGNMIPLLKFASLGVPLPLASVTGRRSMIYIGNVCDAMLKVIKDENSHRPSLQTYFLNDNHNLTSGELYRLICLAYSNKEGLFSVPLRLLRLLGGFGTIMERIFPVNFFINNRNISRLLDESKFSSDKFMKDYDWVPPYHPKEGIEETVKWHSNRV